jgi:hypothetical protein
MCWKDCMRACDKNIQKSNRMGIGSCTMTVPLLTQPWVSSSFWLKENGGGSSPHTCPTSLCGFFLFPWMKHDMKGRRFVDVAGVQRELLVALDSICFEDFRRCSQQWVVLGLLHPVTEGLIWRGLKFQTCSSILNKFFLTIPGIFVSPSYDENSYSYICSLYW